MNKLFTSSVGRKMLVALSAVGLVLFLIGHLLGNLLIFMGPEAMNAYALSLQSYPLLLWSARLGLLAIFLIHLGLGLQLTIQNRRARPVAYIRKNTVQASLASRFMALSGLVMLSYLIYHLAHFTFGAVHSQYFSLKDDLDRHDVYSMVVMSFQEPAIAVTYIVALFLTLLHLSHGIPSLFQSIGWNSPSFAKSIRLTGQSLALILFLGYASIPTAIYLGLVRLP